jgi:arylsulfatase A-like enzyme
LTDHAETLAEILQAKGYATLAAVSARHLDDKNSNFGQGFDDYLDCKKRSIPARKRNGRFFNKLKDIRGRPFFAWIHYFDPHGDYRPPRRYAQMYQPLDDHDPVPSSKRMESEVAKSRPMVDPDDIIPLYKGEITYMDSEIGRLLTLLDELGISDRTLVVLIADHGESMTEKGIYFCHAGMYNQVLHVPLIVRWPGRVPAGMAVNSLTGSVDILPTVLELLGVETVPGDIDGRSLVPALANPDTVLHEVVFSESVDGRVRAVYAGEFKLIKTYNPGWATREDHLYRAFEDYGEQHDLKHRMPDRMMQLEASLDDWLEAAAARALTHEAEGHGMDEKTEKALRALGYIE